MAWRGVWRSSTGGGAANPAGANKDVQFNDGGVFGADTGEFDYDKGTHVLTTSTVASKSTKPLELKAATRNTAVGNDATLHGSDETIAGTRSGNTIVRGGSNSINSGVTGGVRIAAGDSLAAGLDACTMGEVVITSGAIPALTQPLGTLISIKPQTPALHTNTSGVGAAGGGVEVIAGGGQAEGTSGLVNSQAGAGGPLQLGAGAGGASATAGVGGTTRAGGDGGAVNIAGGAGGNGPGSGASTNRGGNGGDIVLTPGVAGTGSTSNGTPGTIALAGARISMANLPTTDPAIAGLLWNNNGAIAVSAGASVVVGQFLMKQVRVTNAQIKTLPTTPVQIIAAPGVGYRTRILQVGQFLNVVTATYGNIDPTDAAIALCPGDATGPWFYQGPVNDSTTTTPLDDLTRYLGGAVHDSADQLFNPIFQAIPGLGNLWVTGDTAPGYAFSSAHNQPVNLSIDNNGAGNLTGGDVLNSLLLTVYYTIEAIS